MIRHEHTHKATPNLWPSWFYGPEGESDIFDNEDEVPFGWVMKPGQTEEKIVVTDPVKLDRSYLIKKLQEAGVLIGGTWSTAYMKELVDNGQQQP